MKFSDGYWQVGESMRPHYAAQVHEAEFEIILITWLSLGRS